MSLRDQLRLAAFAKHTFSLKIHLHRWIIIKACYYIRNMKLKRPSGANEYDTLADMDPDAAVSSQVPIGYHSAVCQHADSLQSPHGTPQSLSPPGRVASAGAELEVKPVNFKKRKISARMSLSDGEEHPTSPAKRPYSTMPIGRKDSPRTSLKSFYASGPGSLENIPPLQSQAHHFSPPLGPASESGRIHLSPLANNELNGVSRPPGAAQTSTLGSFTPVNTGSFTAVNTPPALRETAREDPRAPSRDPHLSSPTQNHRDAPTYTSPYEPASKNSTTTQNHPDPRPVPSMSTSPALPHGFQPTAGSPVANGPNGVSTRESPILQHAHQPHVTPQSQPQALPPVSSQLPTPVQPPAQLQASPPTRVLPQPLISNQHQPPSRSNTPSLHHQGRSLPPLIPSRSGTPLAQVATLPPPQASVVQPVAVPPVPIVQSTPVYGTQPMLAQQPPATAPSGYVPPPPHQHPPQHPIHHQPVLKSQAPEVAQVVPAPHPASRAAVATTDFRLLQCEVTAGLFTFFYPRSTSPPDEPALLQRLHTLWYHGGAHFERDLGPHYDLISKIFTAWLHERQAITALRHSLASQPGVTPMGLVDRLLAMNDLRVMRLKWKNMSTVDGLSPEDLLCMAFRVMTKHGRK